MAATSRMKVMVDLSVAADGYSGIPQDTRQIFCMLSGDPGVAVSGLMYPLEHAIPIRMKGHGGDAPARIAAALHTIGLSRSSPGARNSLVRRIGRIRDHLEDTLAAVRTGHDTYQVPDWLKTDMLWRALFQKTLPAGQREHLLAGDFYLADVSMNQLYGRVAYLPYLKSAKLRVRDQDTVLFPLPRPFRLGPKSQKVVRYHDAIPLTQPDTVHWLSAVMHHRMTNLCAADSIFVCNSPMSRQDLDNVAPGAGDHAVVIPCAIQPALPLRHRAATRDILLRRMSLTALGMNTSSNGFLRTLESIERRLQQTEKLRHVISVSVLDQRKNFVGLIAAWERLRAASGEDIKLVLVGEPRPSADSILTAMRPHVLAGRLVHLEKVPFGELQVLYEGAEMCAFVPFAEGFGYCPLEAMQMGAPVVASDIPVLRWTLGKAALFADPYNVGDIADAMMGLLDSPQNRERRAQMRQSAAAVLERFAFSAVSQHWSSFFQDQLSRLSEAQRKEGSRPHRASAGLRLERLMP
jgi:glycosyltransferase involved in cell wall biosynthesis